jgi:hypothetical protein
MRDDSLLDKIIVGRVDPYIYAFTTNTVPNYLKVGDTYRPISVRLNEWKRHYPDLEKKFEHKALVSDNVFYRDYSIHQYLENDLEKKRLTTEDIDANIYYSNEFFKETSVYDVEEAINDIQKDFEENLMKYQFYNADENLRLITQYASTGLWKLRPNQKQVVENFKKALEKGRNNLLLYAVMRFGKSFTSMCCAVEMGANIVLIVSAKADVKEEWKKTVQSADNFNEYDFIESEELLRDSEIIKHKLEQNKKVVIFATLQDLQGNEIKEKHKELFESNIDLILVDETHFGARAEKYGAVLRDIKDNRDDSYIDFKTANEQIKTLNSKVKIHLSGTPYRILMGSEFTKDDIIGFYQFTDIVNDQEKWDNEHILDDNYKEWDNPYYGFPQMIRFAFNPSKSIREKMEELRNNGVSFAFSELLKPLSIKKDENNNHKKFKYENEVFELLEVIDGSKTDSEVLSFLDYDKIKEGNMCRHIVVVLPYCASCDAMESLIKTNSTHFKNLNEYEIINISGVDKFNLYKKVTDVKNKIKECEKNNIKTITLTVNRMLTGSTVEEWDTMIYLKDTSSPQEYDQAIFRLQNQYIKQYISEDGDIIKYNKKPQTLLVDFDPNRMFVMQEAKSLIYNVNTEKNGNQKLNERLERELQVSPIIVINKDKIKEITAVDILQYISNYSNERSVLEETNDLPVDFKLLNIDEIREVILRQSQLGTKGGLKITNTDDEPDDDLNIEVLSLDLGDTQSPSIQENDNENNPTTEDDKIKKSIVNKFRTYYIRILFYSFLSNSVLNSLETLIESLEKENNERIAKNLGLEKNTLQLIYENIDPFILSQLDYKIQNINHLSNDENLNEIDRALVAINKFYKLSESEIVTPQNVCNEMISLFSNEEFKNILCNGKILDIASKEGEFALALYTKALQLGIEKEKIVNSIYSIPTSTVAYEFTRKIYEILGLNIKNISRNVNTYNMLDIHDNNDNIDFDTVANIICSSINNFDEFVLEQNLFTETEENKMKFNAVVGNPPYQEETVVNSNSNGQNPRRNIFHYFQLQSMKLTDNKTVLIYPGIRWIHQSGKGLKQFGHELINDNRLETLIFYPNGKQVFPNTDLPDGISIVDINLNKTKSGFNYKFVNDNISLEIEQSNPGDSLLVVNPSDNIISKKIDSFVEKHNLKYLHDSVLSRSLFGIESDFVDKNKTKIELFDDNKKYDFNKKIKLLTNDKSGPAGRSKWFVADRNVISQNQELISQYQVVVSSAHPGGQDGRDNQLSIIDNNSVFGRARVALKSFKTLKEAENFYKYINSKIIKFAFLLTDENLSSLGKAVPDVLDYSSNSIIDFTKDIDKQLIELLKITKEEYEYILSRL